MQLRIKKRQNDGSVRSLAEFMDRASRITDKWCKDLHFAPWFRGQGRTSDQLLPSIYRRPNRYLREFDCRFDFRLRAYPFLEGAAREPESEWEWYFLMQHHGLPTRLLDWTESALVALYFAIANDKSKEDAAVWMLDPWAINHRIARISDRIFGAEDKEMKPYLPLDESDPVPAPPVALQAPYSNRRIAAQKGCFTIHGSARIALEGYARLKGRLCKIEIARPAIQRMREQLAIAGVTQSAVFPDLSSLASELLDYWR